MSTEEVQVEPIDLEAGVAALAATIPAPVITEPEELPPPQLPYEKQYRVPEALLDLERDTAERTRIDVQRLVILEGVVAGARKGALFEVRADRAVEKVSGYLVAYRGGDGRLHAIQKFTRPSAMERWADVKQSIEVIARALAAAEELSLEGSVVASEYVIDARAAAGQ